MIDRDILKIENWLTKSEMSDIDNELLEIGKNLKKIVNKNKSGNIISKYARIYIYDYYVDNIDKSKIIYIIKSNLFNVKIFNILDDLVREPLLRLIRFSTHDELQYTVYEQGGNYVWHVDSSKPNMNQLAPHNRVANFIYYLNDDFEGGELELSYSRDIDITVGDSSIIHNPPISKIIKPKKNTLVIMPSDMWHRVKPIIKGKRRTINGHIGFK
jgi:Rps23 Pro-64 3,4-dihydroxylase Tpa1-like proline 4-hydroxylase